MKKYNLFFILGLLVSIGNLQASEIYIDTFLNNPAQDLSLRGTEKGKFEKTTRNRDKAIAETIKRVRMQAITALSAAEDKAIDATFCCVPLIYEATRSSLNALFYPGQALTTIKHYDLDSQRCEIKMSDFKRVQCNRCCIFGGAACALGCGALACSTCGCAGVAAATSTGSKMCAAGACITPQIPVEFSFELPTGRSKDS